MRARIKRAALDGMLKRRNERYSDLARHLGISRAYLSEVVTGHTEPGPDFRQRLMDLFGVTDWDVLFELVPEAESAVAA